MLGPLEVTSEGAPLELGGPKQRALLALLLLDAGRAVSTDRLIGALWGEQPPRTAATTWALRPMTQRFVMPGGGKSAIVNGLPSGAVTNLDLGRSLSNINPHATD